MYTGFLPATGLASAQRPITGPTVSEPQSAPCSTSTEPLAASSSPSWCADGPANVWQLAGPHPLAGKRLGRYENGVALRANSVKFRYGPNLDHRRHLDTATDPCGYG